MSQNIEDIIGFGRNTLLFGCLTLSFDVAALQRVRKAVAENEDNFWFLDVIRTLPKDCETVFEAIPELYPETERAATISQLVALHETFASGQTFDAAPSPLPNSVLVPVAVIAQLAQYTAFLRQQDQRHYYRKLASGGIESLGLCTGMLSAFAVSSAHNTEQFRKFAATAVRLGLLVGLLVDGQDATSGRGRSKSLTAVWSSAQGRETLLQIIKGFDETYISVYYDENRVTITTSAENITVLTGRLRAAGLVAHEIGLHGRFHSKSSSTLVDQVIAFCDSHAEFQFPDAAELAIPTRSTDESGSLLQNGSLHAHALRAILVEPAQWFKTFSNSIGRTAGQDDYDDRTQLTVLEFDTESSVPPSLASRTSSSQDVKMIRLANKTTGSNNKARPDHQSNHRMAMDSDIAVVGMSCKIPGANNLEEFWDLLLSGKSQHREITSSSDRFSFENGPFRSATDPGMDRKWFANLMEGHDQFDHKFFKKSARESASMDPQQRQILMAAYQAVEQSGYFQNHHRRSRQAGAVCDPTRIGCFVGVCLNDYENNVACYPANALSATGNLQGFVSGKVSHFFGWTGPSITLNTACSSSLVAVHQACQSIITGECEAALAGGTHVLTTAEWFQNLGAGSFLSTTGQCKPFDKNADGYCRSEGTGAVYLKRLRQAQADGDPILGVIAATAVQQNQNCTPIFVPNVPSLGDLFTRVMAKAHVEPSQVSVVEAHGTGTAVGDPAEYDSIRRALGGAARRGLGNQLTVSSVKGLVGHMECTSGVISLVKILLMMKKGVIPPQASFEQANPALKTSPSDQMNIPTRASPWDSDLRVALINNYGASGSNASAVIIQAPAFRRSEQVRRTIHPIQELTGFKHPFWFSGFDDRSLRRNIAAFQKYMRRSASQTSVANLSFNLAAQSNRGLESNLMLTASSIEELEHSLTRYMVSRDLHKPSSLKASSQMANPKIVLCFGGQSSSFIGLDPSLYHGIAILRKHLDEVDSVIQSLPGCSSIFPGIFQRSPVDNIIQLQTMLFATQYACSQSWIDVGISPAALVGHSFGELTALCVAGILSLEDTVKLIVRRASIIRDSWGPDRGAMMAAQGSLDEVNQLLAVTNAATPSDEPPVTIACYNGPTSFTLAGSTRAIDALAAQMSSENGSFNRVKCKKLNVTHAFHSVLVDAIHGELAQATRGLTFRKAKFHLEPAIAGDQAIESQQWLTADFVADHMRNPVYFHHAVERLAWRLGFGPSSPPIVLLEAGTNSSIASIASRAVQKMDTNKGSTFFFHGLNLANCDNGWDNLTETTMSLWKTAQLKVHHWAHHPSQRAHCQSDIEHLLLPPYQFDPESRHWLALKAPLTKSEVVKPDPQHEQEPERLLAFVGHRYKDSTGQKEQTAVFRIGTTTPEYQRLLSGHVVLRTAPILSATLQISFVIDAIGTVCPEYKTHQRQPQVQDVEYQSPVCFNPARTLWVEVTRDTTTSDGQESWSFEVFSSVGMEATQQRTMHTTGKVSFSELDSPVVKRELARLERLFGHHRVAGLLHSGQDADEVLSNRNIYSIFRDVVDYGDEFRGMQKMVKRGNETAGHVERLKPISGSERGESFNFDAHLEDTFCQLGGLWINCMTESSDHGVHNHVYLANGIEQWIRSYPANTKLPGEFNVFAAHQRPSDQLCITDVFVFDPASGALVEAILGIAYVKIPRLSMEKMLTRLSSWEDKSSPSQALVPPIATAAVTSNMTNMAIDNGIRLPLKVKREVQQPTIAAIPVRKTTQSASEDDGEFQKLLHSVKAVIADLSGLDTAEIQDDSELADLGIDSLTGMEMVHEIESSLKVKLPEDEIFVVTDIPGLMKCVAGATGVTMKPQSQGTHHDPADSDSDDISSITAPSESSTAGQTNNTNLSTPFPELDVEKMHNEGHEETTSELKLSLGTVIEAFRETKTWTDRCVRDLNQASYISEVLPLQNALTVALTIEVFEALGAGFQQARPTERLPRISHSPENQRFVAHLYEMLEAETQIIKLDGDVVTRTAVPLPDKNSEELLAALLKQTPDQHSANHLIYYAGKNLARVLSGEASGVKVIFGDEEGRNLVSKWYAEWPLNRAMIGQLEDFVGRLATKLRIADTGGDMKGPLRVLEMGSGTGGTSKRLLPLLAQAQIPVEYTFTDLAPSFVHAARKTWAKQYPWLKFRVHDIEKEPAEDLRGTQHLVVASNAIHATRSLRRSLGNVRKALCHDGYLIMMEMTRTPYWVDLIFGLFEGWWLFDDGRKHALTHERVWETELHAAGYGMVDWTDGEVPETEVQKVLLAAASPTSRCERLPSPVVVRNNPASAACAEREKVVARYVHELTQGFEEGFLTNSTTNNKKLTRPRTKCILITGGTGGLGAHLVATAALRPDVGRVVCLNRPRKGQDPHNRQVEALRKKGIELLPDAAAKLDVWEADLAQPVGLGLPHEKYRSLVDRDHGVTHIVHNAWLMHFAWPVQRFEPQLRIMANMLNLAREISAARYGGSQQGSSSTTTNPTPPVRFEFVSSIATIGHHPLWTGSPIVPEERVPIESVLPTGYGDAKYICERMLDATLHRFPDRFQATAVRLGQIAGSKTNGHWNPMEHVPFLIKSSQTIGALPEFPGILGWTPADDIASALVEILMQPDGVSLYPIYHIENPVRQPWSEALATVAEALGTPSSTASIDMVSLPTWLEQVRSFPRSAGGPQGTNPASLLVDFLETNFIRMSCGGLLMSTAKAREHSKTMAELGPVSDHLIRSFVKRWKDDGFLV